MRKNIVQPLVGMAKVFENGRDRQIPFLTQVKLAGVEIRAPFRPKVLPVVQRVGLVHLLHQIFSRYAKENGFPNPKFYIDDGWSGTNFDRPGYQQMMEDVADGLVSAIIVKDHSRLGRKVYDLCIAGYGPMQIAKQLRQERIPTPTMHRAQNGESFNHPVQEDPYKWDNKVVAEILERMEYLGHTLNFKTSKKSYKSKKKVKNPPEKQQVIRDTHPAIIEQSQWERAQELRKHKRRPSKTGKHSMFSGLLYFADCGAKLYCCTTGYFDESQDHFVCSNYKSNTGTCSIHFIRQSVLEKLVLEHIQNTVRYVRDYEDAFVRMVSDRSAAEQKKELAAKRKTLAVSKGRMSELDRLFQRIYEDNVSGRLSDERFLKLSTGYEAEQKELQEKVSALQEELAGQEQEAMNVERFLTTVRKYTEIQALNATILNEFVEKIIVHAPDKSSGKRQQRVEISYNCVGVLSLPENLSATYMKSETA